MHVLLIKEKLFDINNSFSILAVYLSIVIGYDRWQVSVKSISGQQSESNQKN